MTDFDEMLMTAIQHHRAKRLADAQRICCQILEAVPNHVGCFQILGSIASQVGCHETAAEYISKAITVDGTVAELHNNLGEEYRALGRLEAAAACYTEALRLKPGLAMAHNNLGNVLRSQGRLEEAVACYTEALRLKPDLATAHNNLGSALKGQDRLEEAVACYAEALRLKPDYADAHNNLGTALKEQGRLEEAVACYTEALRLKPGLAVAHSNLGNALRSQGRLEEAVACYTEALRLKPSLGEAYLNLGNVLREQGRLEEAVACYTAMFRHELDDAEAPDNLGDAQHQPRRLEEAIACYTTTAHRHKPDAAEAHSSLGGVLLDHKPDYAEAHHAGLVLHGKSRWEEAEACYIVALRYKPDDAQAHCDFANLLMDLGRREEALAYYREALRLDPSLAEAEWGLCTGQLPIIYTDAAEIDKSRSAYATQLRDLSCRAEHDPDLRRRLARTMGIHQPFLLPYQGRNDRELQALHGGLLARVAAELVPPLPVAPLAGPEEPIRVGFVSGFFRQHSVWKIPLKGWLTELDRRRFRLFGYHTEDDRLDAETATASALFERFVQGPLRFERWVEQIRADAPHVLIYPELGMDHMSMQLAVHRLAPVQCTSWGHPTTSGLPTIDYFLSSDLMEPPEGEHHYTERLVRLANLSVFWEPPPAPARIARAEIGLRPEAVIYWCCQAVYKYLPQFDEIFPRIAAAVGDCQFCFIRFDRGKGVDAAFWSRLQRAFAAHGMKAEEHCVFLPRMRMTRFAAVARAADVFLDSIGWSGCNSALESLTHDLPIVTLPGPLMRGRHSMAILTMMGVTETIARSVDDYVGLAVRLGREPASRAAMRQRIAANKHRLYRDRRCIEDLDTFLEQVGRAPAEPGR